MTDSMFRLYNQGPGTHVHMTGYAKNSQTELAADRLESHRADREPVVETKNQAQSIANGLEFHRTNRESVVEMKNHTEPIVNRLCK